MNLLIIGYASVIETPTLPRLLPAVFLRGDSVILPPYSIVGWDIYNFNEVTQDEFEGMVQREQITKLPKPTPFKPYHDLWVNADGEVAYTNSVDRQKAFKVSFKHHLDQAQKTWKSGQSGQSAAYHHAAIARALNPNHIQPLVIRAAVEQQRDLQHMLSFTRHIASELVSPEEFDCLVQEMLKSKYIQQ